MGVPINNVTRRVVYAASGTGPYNFTFEILAATDIAVYRDDTLLTLTTNYTVTINSNGTGFVTLTATPTGATQIAIVGNRTISRTTDFVTGGDFFANTLNDELDQQTIFAQQNAEGLQRALQAPQTDPTSINMTLPGRTTRANKTLTFDANGNPTAGVSAADVANAVTYATNAANSATAAAASASAASSSASSASSSASTATTQASNASSSASAASTSASNASTSATNAANSASSASTSASNASTSATNAANSASTATTQASNAATSATNAANSATAAATSETNAANSATAAASSATAAAASASAAANTFDSFDDRYLGTKASNPTVDNDGNALVAGALYFSTSENIMKVYDGASWIAATSAGNVSFLRFRYVATSGQTTFSGADSNAATLSYTVNNIVVFLNGVSLDQTEYTATSGTSVVLGTGAALNDELVVVAFKSFVTADMVPASTGGTYAGAVRFVAGSASVPSISVSGDTNTGIYFPAADTVAIGTGGTEALRVNSAQSLLLNTTSAPAASAKMKIATSARTGAFFDLTATGGENWIIDSTNTTGSTDVLGVYANGATGWYLQDNGNVGIGTTSPVSRLAVNLANTAFSPSQTSAIGSSNATRAQFTAAEPGVMLTTDINGSGTQTGSSTISMGMQIGLYNTNDIRNQIWWSGGYPLTFTYSGTPGASPTERARITSGGIFLVGKTATGIGTVGSELGQGGDALFTASGNPLIYCNRLASDGNLVEFRQDGITEGTISVSGTTVSYNGGHLARWSQLLNGQRDESILKGTVLSNLDEMCEWLDAEGNPLPNEQLNRTKVSDVEGDTNVAGVFVNWDNDDQDNPYDMNIAMTGDMIIRIAQGVTVQKGDLLMSAGDGTAKPQGDDIVRSKTVAKVTSNHVTCTYDDGSYCVPCVLMAC